MRYPLAPNPIFWSWQGEGHLQGLPMGFIRLGGCSVGCAGCDTDYRVTSRATEDEIVDRLRAVTPAGERDRWAWITGGEPTDHDLRPLLGALKRAGYSTAVATSGANRLVPPVDWLSVSPHSIDEVRFRQRYGSELKLCDGLNSVSAEAWAEAWPDARTDFMFRYVQPLSVSGREDPGSLARCIAFVKSHPNWGLSQQRHLTWGVP